MSIFDIFKELEKKRGDAPGKPEWIIAGLGNPGKKYEKTRHNTGFMMLDKLCERIGAKVSELKFGALVGRAKLAETSVLLMKPQTFMNLSGEAIKKAADFYKIPPSRILVVYDDVSLPCGKLRIRAKGSAGGHNGIKNIISQLGTDVFPRIKVGVGSPEHPDFDMIDWVLGSFSESDLKLVSEANERACDAAPIVMQEGCEKAAAKFN